MDRGELSLSLHNFNVRVPERGSLGTRLPEYNGNPLYFRISQELFIPVTQSAA